MNMARITVCAVVLSLGLALQLSAGEQWPGFRGPTGDGQAADANLPSEVAPGNVAWRVDIPGKGWSSPVIWGDQIWLTTATEDGSEMSVICRHLQDGRELFNRVLVRNEEPAFCHPMNSYASPTPVIEAGRVYVHFGAYLTACIDTNTFKLVWERRDLECDHHRGPASSPILFDGKLFVAYDGFDQQYVLALDKQTGETVWKRDREIDYGTDNGDLKKAYGTASVIHVDGKPLLIYPSAIATIAYDVDSGDSVWITYHAGMNASARPVFVDGLVYIINGMGAMVAVRPDGTGDVTKTHVGWSSERAIAKKSSPIIVDGKLYMNSDDGIVTCRDAKSGELHWQERIGGKYAASPIFAGGRIYCFGMDGEIVVFRPGDQFDLVSSTKLGDGFMASPAVVGDTLILRDKTGLFCVRR
jgi:outer membrane protein assembly factor BamB